MNKCLLIMDGTDIHGRQKHCFDPSLAFGLLKFLAEAWWGVTRAWLTQRLLHHWKIHPNVHDDSCICILIAPRPNFRQLHFRESPPPLKWLVSYTHFSMCFATKDFWASLSSVSLASRSQESPCPFQEGTFQFTEPKCILNTKVCLSVVHKLKT